MLAAKAASVGLDWRTSPASPAASGGGRRAPGELPGDTAPDDLPPAARRRLEAEHGDLLQALSNLARHLGLNAEDGLRLGVAMA